MKRMADAFKNMGISFYSNVITELLRPIITFAPSDAKPIRLFLYGMSLLPKKFTMYSNKVAVLTSSRAKNNL